MKKTATQFKLFPMIVLMLSCAALAFAEGEKERMIQRAPQIRALKTSGAVGERANGLLGLVKESAADKALVDAENADRKAVYAEIARGSGGSVTAVANRRALQIVEQAATGDWLQGTDGKWYQKK
jgi:uncharacterized protein YdbL (DUF1318 family)